MTIDIECGDPGSGEFLQVVSDDHNANFVSLHMGTESFVVPVDELHAALFAIKQLQRDWRATL